MSTARLVSLWRVNRSDAPDEAGNQQTKYRYVTLCKRFMEQDKMLAYILAIAVAVGSFALYMAAFFFPEVHRKNDLFWSGVGLFYALILWVCAGRITGAVLLGQVASVSLLGWFSWQTLMLRRTVAPNGQKTPIPEPLKERVNQVLASPSSAQQTGVDQSVQLEKSPEPEAVIPVMEPDTVKSERITPVEEKPSTVIEEAVEVAEEFTKTAIDKAQEAGEVAAEFIETATDKGEEFIETATDKAQEAGEVAGEVIEIVTDKAKEAAVEVKKELQTLSEAPSSVKSKPKRQNAISKLLGTVTGLFKGKPKPKASTKTEAIQTEAPDTTATLETESTERESTETELATPEIVEDSPSETETVEVVDESVAIETAEPETITTPSDTDSKRSNKSPFEELTSASPEPEADEKEAALIELADAVDQSSQPVVQTNSPATVNLGNIEEPATESDSTTETVEIVEEPATPSDSTTETVEIVEEPATSSDSTVEEVTTAEKPEEAIAEPEPETETETQSSQNPPTPGLKRPKPPNQNRKRKKSN